MATVKVTFTFDEDTVRLLNQAAERVRKPKSQVVREAIRDYYERTGKLSERERQQWLEAFDRLLAKIPSRPQSEVDAEIESIRQARRGGGRRSRSD